jgi:hypothetical protein
MCYFHVVKNCKDHSERKSLQGRLNAKVSNARVLWLFESNKHPRNELYLGRLPFHNELRRSCEEFYATLRNIWGFRPLKLFYMKLNYIFLRAKVVMSINLNFILFDCCEKKWENGCYCLVKALATLKKT